MASTPALLIFAAVYLGMVLGGLPLLRLDRTGVALLGAIAVIGFGLMSTEQAAQAVHLPTLLILFAFMVVSAQLRLGGFYTAVTLAMVGLRLGPRGLMAAVIGTAGALSAVFSNDIVCLAMAPVLAQACLQRRLAPVPYLLALACAANIGSAATLIGNPQNMLIGEVLQLDFAAYLTWALPPVLAGLLLLWAWMAWALGRASPAPGDADAAALHTQADRLMAQAPPLDRLQAGKGVLVAAALVGVFALTDWPRDVAAMVGAGVLLLSRRLPSGRVLGLVDWPLLLLFIGLFIVNQALADTGWPQRLVQALADAGLPLSEPLPLAGLTLVLSNLVSNVPAVMLMLPAAQAAPGAHVGPTLALVSTLAGNLFIVGSIANLIVVDAARQAGIAIDWRQHLRVGLPVTLLSLGATAAWLAWMAG